MRECYSCGSIKTYVKKNGLSSWYRNRPFEQWLCENCNNKFVKHPKWHPISNPISNKKWNPINNARRIWFRDRKIKLGYSIRKGYCSRCSNNIYDKTCKSTHMHHWIYIRIFPWFGTEELCANCHQNIPKKIKKIVGRF